MVAIGGIAGALRRSGTPEYTANVMGAARQLGTKAHLLGVGNLATLTAVRPYSADSSDFSMGNRYASVKVWDPKTRDFVAVHRTMKLTRSVVALLHTYDATPKDIATWEWWTGNLRFRGAMRVSAWSTFRFMEHLARLGVRFFIALNTSDVLIMQDLWNDYVTARAA